jgi:cytochrome c oxidase subunit IV
MAHGAASAPMRGADHAHEHEHPSDRKYVQIAIFLTIVTLVEVIIYYIDWMHDSGALVPTLFVLSAAKFVTVVGYYMHLKFDAPLFRQMFIGGLVVSIAVIIAVIILLVTHRIDYGFSFL